MLGSTALHVMRGAKCSVEIVRRTSDDVASEPMRILVATDGSEFSQAAATVVAKRPWPLQSEARVLAAPEITMLPLQNEVANAAVWEELLEMRIAQAKDAAASACEILAGSKLRVDTRFPLSCWNPRK